MTYRLRVFFLVYLTPFSYPASFLGASVGLFANPDDAFSFLLGGHLSPAAPSFKFLIPSKRMSLERVSPGTVSLGPPAPFFPAKLVSPPLLFHSFPVNQLTRTVGCCFLTFFPSNEVHLFCLAFF